MKKLRTILIIILLFNSYFSYCQYYRTVIFWSDSSKKCRCCQYLICSDSLSQNDTINRFETPSELPCKIIIGHPVVSYLRFYNCGTDTLEFNQQQKGIEIEKSYYPGNLIKRLSKTFNDSDHKLSYRETCRYFLNGRLESVALDTIIRDTNASAYGTDYLYIYYPHGLQYTYYDNGNIESIIGVQLGKLDGIYIKFYRNFHIMFTGRTKDNEKIGRWYIFNEEGKLVKKLKFKPKNKSSRKVQLDRLNIPN